jgi:hypothetical protein
MAKPLELRKYETNATLSTRVMAFFIDVIVLYFVAVMPFRHLFLKAFPYEAGFGLLTQTNIIIPGYIYASMFIISMLFLFYFSITEYFLKQTPGKMLMNIYVRGNTTFLKSLMRNIFLIPFFPFYLLWITEPIYLLTHKYRFLEHITKTRTVEKITTFGV